MKIILTALMFTFGIVGCSHMKNHDKHHSDANNKKPTIESSSNSISVESFINSPDLSPAQKAQLKSIYERVFSQSRMYRSELIEAKNKMFKTLATRDYKSTEITKLKKEVVEIDQKRLELMFSALAEVQGVVGYGEDKEKIYRQLRDYDRHQTDYHRNIE